MYAGAALSGIAAVIGLTAVGSVRTTLRNQTNPALSTSQINLAVNVFIVGVVVVGLIGIGLWLWMAVKSKAGRNWARITGTVFFRRQHPAPAGQHHQAGRRRVADVTSWGG